MPEESLQTFQEPVDDALRQVNGLARRLKKLGAAAQAGELREIAKGVSEIGAAAAAAADIVAGLEFPFDEEAYFPDGFLKELAETAAATGMRVFARDGNAPSDQSLIDDILDGI